MTGPTATGEKQTRQGVRLTGRTAYGATGFGLQTQLSLGTETVALLGPNGSGKTTLLRVLAGLQPLLDGSLQVDGVEWSRLAPQQRSVGLMLADPLLFPQMSVLDNVGFGLVSRGASRERARAAAEEELAAVGLADLAGRRATQVSTGQAARIALARALATKPRLLLLDEPLSSLDPDTGAEVRSMLQRRLAAYEGTAVMVTHDGIDALTMADRLLFIDGGQVVDAGTPTQVVARPTSAFAARMVGVNLLPGEASDERISLRNSVVHSSAHVVNGPVWVAIRPSAVSLWPEKPHGSPRNTWQLTIRSIDLAGQVARVGLTGEVDLIAEVTTQSVSSLRLSAGSQLWASVKATEVDAYPR